LLSRTVAVLVRALAMLLSERFQQKYLTRLAGASPHVMPATELPAQKS
jgi:hypothetical protein